MEKKVKENSTRKFSTENQRSVIVGRFTITLKNQICKYWLIMVKMDILRNYVLFQIIIHGSQCNKLQNKEFNA